MLLECQENMDNLLQGKHRMDMPGFNTIKILEKRKSYILHKLKTYIISNNEKSSDFLIEEARALKKTINFLRWIKNNFEDEDINKIIEKYKDENNINETEIDEDKEMEGILLFNLQEKRYKGRKIDIYVLKNEENNFVVMEDKIFDPNKIKWEIKGRISMTINKYVKILGKVIKLMENGKNNDI